MGKKNTMGDLRDHLFDVLERLKDPDDATLMDVETAKTIVNLADTLIDTQRVENEFIRAIGEDNFLANSRKAKPRFLLTDGEEER